MMLAHDILGTPIYFNEGYVPSLVIENQDFFRSFLEDIQCQLRGCSGSVVLSEGEMTLDWSKYGDLIDSFLSFDLNRKPLLNKILAAMETTALSESFYEQTASLLTEIELWAEDLTFNLPCGISVGGSTVSSLLKTVGVSISDDYEDPLERVFDYMELIREFDRDRVFVLVNLRSYFSDSSVERFLDTVLRKDLMVLLVDSSEHARLSMEHRLVIDKDLCLI